MSVKLEAGQWYRTRGGSIVRCVAGGARYAGSFIVECFNSAYYVLCDGKHVCGNANLDLVEHLPDCTGFDWEPLKPVVAPEGWEIIKDGVCTSKDKILLASGEVTMVVPNGTIDGETIQYALQQLKCIKAVAIIRKIEPKYRPFANAEEFKPHRDKWWKYKDGDVIWPPACYSDEGYGDTDWDYCFENQVFEDGSPFGVRVDD